MREEMDLVQQDSTGQGEGQIHPALVRVEVVRPGRALGTHTLVKLRRHSGGSDIRKPKEKERTEEELD